MVRGDTGWLEGVRTVKHLGCFQKTERTMKDYLSILQLESTARQLKAGHKCVFEQKNEPKHTSGFGMLKAC